MKLSCRTLHKLKGTQSSTRRRRVIDALIARVKNVRVVVGELYCSDSSVTRKEDPGSLWLDEKLCHTGISRRQSHDIALEFGISGSLAASKL